MLQFIKDLTLEGYEVRFHTTCMILYLTLIKERNEKVYKYTQSLPVSDHCYDEKVISCFEYMRGKLNDEILNDLKAV